MSRSGRTARIRSALRRCSDGAPGCEGILTNREPDRSGDPDAPRWSSRGLSRRGVRAYQGVLETVLCVPAGTLLGVGLDHWLETEPWFLLTGLGLGFVAFVISAIRLPKRLARYVDEPPEES